ncbi:MAG: flagellar export chaperone FliS [Chitinophagaceae bacterium]|nr:flagellar export chaperone FliS [Rubrivivax sp.]
MFANTHTSRPGAHHHPGGLYRQVGVESQLAGATPHHMVAMLFDGFMEAVAQARGAMRNRDTLAKGQAIGRAVSILEEGLRAGLDLRAGGSLARDLDDLYRYVVLRLTFANLHNQESALAECQQLIAPLQQAWASIAPPPAGAAR